MSSTDHSHSDGASPRSSPAVASDARDETLRSVRSEKGSVRARALRFGLGALLVLGAFGALIAWRKHHLATGGAIAGVGAVVFLVALVAPAAALSLRGAWMKFAAALGWVNTRLLLGVIFFALLTPIALLRRLFSGRSLEMRFRSGGEASYWTRRNDRYDPKHYEHPY
jgi:hypothetical protein